MAPKVKHKLLRFRGHAFSGFAVYLDCRGAEMVIFYLLVLISLTQIPCIIASHFRGGLLTWTAENASQVSMIRYCIGLFFELLDVSRIVNI